MPPESPLRRIIYAGRVQGVGFRMTARRIAGRFAVSGFVRNLRDGTVELVVSGNARESTRFLEALAEEMAGYITAADETAADDEQVGSGFEIRY